MVDSSAEAALDLLRVVLPGLGHSQSARPLEGSLGMQVVAIDPSAAFRKILRLWLGRTQWIAREQRETNMT